MKKSIKKASVNELEELLCLLHRIKDECKSYSHVTDYLPNYILKGLLSYSVDVYNELELRDND